MTPARNAGRWNCRSDAEWTAGAVMVEEVLVMASELDTPAAPEYTVVGDCPWPDNACNSAGNRQRYR